MTSTERSQTRPLVTMVVTAQRSGDFSPLCALLPDRDPGNRQPQPLPHALSIQPEARMRGGRWVLSKLLQAGTSG